MAKGSRITPAQRDHYWALRGQGFSQAKASREAGFSLESAKAMEKDRRTTLGVAANTVEERSRLFRQSGYVPEWPLRPKDWPEAAHEALEDPTGFLFCKRYFGLELSRWQQTMWAALEDGLKDPDRSYLCVNAPPGLGKSTTLVAFAAKATVLNRAVRGLFMSRAYSLAERNTLRLRRSLERTVPFLEADATLACEFGRFKARTGELWRRNEFVVEQADGTPIEEKEPTWAAFGFDSEWLGNRLDILIGDDLDSTRGLRNQDTIDANRDVFDNELEPRIESGGLLVVAQQRLGAWDFSSHVLGKQLLPDDDGETDNPDGEAQYKQIIFKAHYDELCKGTETHAHPAPGWPDGCLLDPRRLSYRDLRKAMRNPRTYQIVFQQNDLADDEALIQKVWIDGGAGADGHVYPGCWDLDRQPWQLDPRLVQSGELITAITVDPSPTNFWSIQAWAFHPDTKICHLLAVHRERMDAPDFLDWSPTLGTFTGIAEEFRSNFERMGLPLMWVIVEINAAQRFMLQYEHFRRWQTSNGMEIVAHSTQRNKADPDYGIQMLQTPYRQGQMRLPGGYQFGRIRDRGVERLVEELTRYPNVSADDCVLANWFLLHNLEKLYNPLLINASVAWRPSWV